MVYSCAYFRHEEDTLATAQEQKLDHVCRKLRLAPGERLLDIGCGWGALVFWAAERYGVDATGITLSRNQAEHVAAEIRRRGLEDRVHVELRDYLDLPDEPCYDKIASIGMFEHVGVARFPQYFGKIRRLLAPVGSCSTTASPMAWKAPRRSAAASANSSRITYSRAANSPTSRM